jgi:hypothetical protein
MVVLFLYYFALPFAFASCLQFLKWTVRYHAIFPFSMISFALLFNSLYVHAASLWLPVVELILWYILVEIWHKKDYNPNDAAF